MFPYNDGCESYVGHLLAEHRRLHVMLRLARSAILQSGGPDRDATAGDVVRTLGQIRDELAHHFAEEEAGGCLEEAVSRSPELSARARSVQAEHPDLLRELDRLIERAEAGHESVRGRLEFERQFQALCERLHAHEAAENDVLRRGFGVTVNGDENGKSTLTMEA